MVVSVKIFEEIWTNSEESSIKLYTYVQIDMKYNKTNGYTQKLNHAKMHCTDRKSDIENT